MDLDRIREGDVAALAALMDAAWNPLVRYTRSLTGSDDQAQDTAQEAFVRLWEHRERWSGGSARAVLFRVARNVAHDQTRRREVRRRGVEALSREPRGCPPGPAEQLAASELRAHVTAALSALPDRRREVFELVRFGGLSYREVSEALELSVQTVANHMSLALRDLRLLLAEAAEDARQEHPPRDGPARRRRESTPPGASTDGG